MKKIVLSLVCAGFALSLSAQDAPKKVQVGLAYQFGFNINKPGTKLIERGGIGVQNALGMNVNFGFNDNIAFSTGLEFDFESFKYHVVSPDAIYYRFEDTQILKKEDGITPGSDLFQLVDRKQKAIYGTIPTMLMFRTNMIGDFRYYGKFGARTSFLLSNTIEDKGNKLAGDTIGGAPSAFTNSDMKAKGDMFFMRSTIGLGGGAEWNFTGNTSVFAELVVYVGFTPVHYGEAIAGEDKQRDMTLFKNNAATNNVDSYTTFSAKQTQVCLKLGILF